MTVKEILDASKEKMSKSVAVYQNEMTSLRAGRANPRLLDRIMVDYYGTPTPLPQTSAGKAAHRLDFIALRGTVRPQSG